MPLQNFIWIIMHNKRIEYFFYKFFRDSFFMFFYTIYLFSYLFFTWFTWFIFISFIYFYPDSLSFFHVIYLLSRFIFRDSFTWFIYFHMIHYFPIWFLHDSLFSQVILSHDSSIFTCDSFIRFAIHMIFFHPIYLLSFVILVVTQCLRLWTPVWKGIIFTYFHVILSYH